MTTYAVTVKHPAGYVTTVRNVSHEMMMDGLVTFGGINLFGTSRQTIIEWKKESHNPTSDEVTCGGRFGCE